MTTEFNRGESLSAAKLNRAVGNASRKPAAGPGIVGGEMSGQGFLAKSGHAIIPPRGTGGGFSIPSVATYDDLATDPSTSGLTAPAKALVEDEDTYYNLHLDSVWRPESIYLPWSGP